MLLDQIQKFKTPCHGINNARSLEMKCPNRRAATLARLVGADHAAEKRTLFH